MISSAEAKEAVRGPGYELVREQLFFRKELMERVQWFIRIRWIAIGVAGGGTWVARFLEPQFPVLPVSLIVFCIFLYNIVLRILWYRLESLKGYDVRSFTAFAHVQISLDLLALYLLIYFTGGIYSPLLMFAIFHIILAGLLLPPVSSFLYCVFVLLATGALVVMEMSTMLRPWPALFQNPALMRLLPAPHDLVDILVFYAFFVGAIFTTAFLITSIKLSLRSKGRDLIRISRELDASNAKLTALYEMLKKMNQCSELQDLMDLATRNAASIMGAKGSSIKLLDESRKRLTFASAYGLSQDYLAKGAIDLEKSLINRKIIEGSYFAVGRIEEEDYFQYPEDVRREGIASMVSFPLRVEKMAMGVFSVYSDKTYYFQDSDIEFFSLMNDVTALAIETLRSQLNKSWFVRKAAHELKAPFTAVHGMLGVMRNEYLGPLNEKQKETLTKSERRLEMLSTLVGDLLKLGLKRTDVDKRIIHPVDGSKVMKDLGAFFQDYASEKGVDIRFEIEDPLPQLMADEKLIDELFVNLISNAIKYTPRGGQVHVSLVKESETHVLLRVCDTGIGIPEEDMPRLFTEFFRAKNAKALTQEGTGLGLVIVKEIVDFLSGTIQVKSEVGKGTCFTCRLLSI
jgi:two-component sensor histidine kinase